MSDSPAFAAVDLGASSGRVVVGQVGRRRLDLHEVHRFANQPVTLPDGPHWDVLALYQGVLDGLRAASAFRPWSVGIDSWGVDFGLLDIDGALIGNPHHYRDARNARAMSEVLATVDSGWLYRVCGLQQLPINTVFQLAAARNSSTMDRARTLLLIPDLMTYWLTGEVGAEATNASTTGLYDATRHRWSGEVLSALDIPEFLLPPLRRAGGSSGGIRETVADEAGVPVGLPVTTVATHDTASAVAAVPAVRDGFAYISCGTWSLAGVELDAPVLSEASRAANFTNELGVDGTVRYLRNIMGLWLLQECSRCWRRRGEVTDEADLLARAEHAPPSSALLDPDDPVFRAPRDMPAAIGEHCARTGQRPPSAPVETVRCIVESLARAHWRTLREAARLSGCEIEVVHIVGGGSRNGLLCQLTADACGLPVVAGPAEATSLGNLLVQARAHGVVADRWDGRELVAATQQVRHYRPRGSRTAT